MTLCNPKSLIEYAQSEGFAIGAFNANTAEQIQAIVTAAQAEKAPAIVQVSHRACVYFGGGNASLGLRYFAAIGRLAIEYVNVPIALHLDHAEASEVKEAISAGFTSVMFDGSLLPHDQNTRVTQRLAEIAHEANVCFEAELGEVPKPGINEAHGDEGLTDPDEAAEFVAATGIDLLAVALGSMHAETEKHIVLDLERLEAIRARVNVPLVLHGSSGVTDDNVAQGIKLGLSKVNLSTQLNKVFSEAVRSALVDEKIVDPRKYLGPARDAMIDVVRERIRFFGAAGKATP
ncbi:MAG: ketose-bisphosphate aldolase [Chloroflexi bacterium]|nr:ketose-bisphosphate aldolase [Chloroflexota bacterium]